MNLRTIQEKIMTNVSQLKCACEPCLCVVSLEDAIHP
ncbi:hypothetical protein [Scytonema sp. HK-05]